MSIRFSTSRVHGESTPEPLHLPNPPYDHSASSGLLSSSPGASARRNEEFRPIEYHFHSLRFAPSDAAAPCSTGTGSPGLASIRSGDSPTNADKISIFLSIHFLPFLRLCERTTEYLRTTGQESGRISERGKEEGRIVQDE